MLINIRGMVGGGWQCWVSSGLEMEQELQAERQKETKAVQWDLIRFLLLTKTAAASSSVCINPAELYLLVGLDTV